MLSFFIIYFRLVSTDLCCCILLCRARCFMYQNKSCLWPGNPEKKGWKSFFKWPNPVNTQIINLMVIFHEFCKLSTPFIMLHECKLSAVCTGFLMLLICPQGGLHFSVSPRLRDFYLKCLITIRFSLWRVLKIRMSALSRFSDCIHRAYPFE